MRNILLHCLLAFAILAMVKGDLSEMAAEDKLVLTDEMERDEMQEHVHLQMPILKDHPYPFCKVRYQACKITVNDECKCTELLRCCNACYKLGVFCRALPQVCLWVSLKCQCECLADASDKEKRCSTYGM